MTDSQPIQKPPSDVAGSTSARRSSASKSPRSRAREFVVQGLYQTLVGKNDLNAVDEFTRGLAGFHKIDQPHYQKLLEGCVENAEALNATLLPCLDRKLTEVSPIEHAVLWLGLYEFLHCPEIPWRVVINESVELTKEFGGTDGHKFVNGILNQLAKKVRATEVQADMNLKA
jgi:transcription antitermination protein NusB